MVTESRTKKRSTSVGAKAVRVRVQLEPKHFAQYVDGLRQSVDRLSARLESLPPGSGEARIKARLMMTLRMAEQVASMLMGECERARPYSRLKFVQREDGLHMCCNHNPSHCQKVKDK